MEFAAMHETVTTFGQSLPAKSLEGDLVQPGHPLFGLIWVTPARMSGTPCFAGTRVPVQTLFDYLEGGETLDEFLQQFPSVKREQALAALELARDSVLSRAPSA